MNRRFLHGFAAVWFSIVSVVLPVKAFAIAPLVALGMGVEAITAGGSVSLGAATTSAITSLIGGTIMALAITPSSLSDGSVPTGVRLAATIDPVKTAAAMPPPSAPVSASPVNNVSAAEMSQNMYMCDAGGGYWACGGQVSAAYCLYTWLPQDRSYPVSCRSIGGDGNPTPNYYYRPGLDPSYSLPVSSATVNNLLPSSCGNGYTASGSSCALSDARAAVSDGKADYIKGASGWTKTDMDGAGYITSSNGTTYIASGKDTSGNPVLISVAGTADGGNKVDIYTQLPGSSSSIQHASITTDSSGVVTSGSSTLTGGQISNLSTPTASVTTVNGMASATTSASGVTTGTVSATDAQSQPIVFPSDYARVGEAAGAASVVKASVDSASAKLDNTVSVPDVSVPAWSDPWGNTFGNLLSWSLPAHTSICPQPSFDWNGHIYVIGYHCDLWNDHSGPIGAAALLIWVVVALGIVLKS